MRRLGWVLLAMAMSVSAETYRCEIGGKVVYGDKPCEAGVGKKVEVTEISGEDRLQAQQRLQQDKKEMEALRRDRLKKEAVEEKARQKAARQAQKQAAKAEKKRKAHCKSLAKRPPRYWAKHPEEREEYERECLANK